MGAASATAHHLKVTGCAPEAWQIFRQHHYLSGGASPQLAVLPGKLERRPVAFAAVIPAAGHYRVDRVTRVVVLPA